MSASSRAGRAMNVRTESVCSFRAGRTAVDVESPQIDIPVTTGPGGGIPAQANVLRLAQEDLTLQPTSRPAQMFSIRSKSWPIR
jgi:hypothetical protein